MIPASARADEAIAITGMGAVTPIAVGVEAFWAALVAGRSGVALIRQFDASQLPVRFAAEVKSPEWEAGRCVPELAGDPRASRSAMFAVAAAREAIHAAQIDTASWDPLRAGVYMGVAVGRTIEPCLTAADPGVLDWASFGKTALEHTDPHRFWQISAHMVTGWVSRSCNASGAGTTIMTACTASAQAIGTAMHAIRRGEVDVALAGGASSMIDPVGVIGFSRLQALSTRNDDPAAASRPFDRTRDGFVLGEGAGVLVLEALHHARHRGATIIATLAGYGSSSDAYRLTDGDPEALGATRAMAASLAMAGCEPRDVGYINAHGTSTVVNDRAETKAIKKLLGPAAHGVPISSNKSMIGHLIAAAGAVEAIATALTVSRGIIPQTINYGDPDPECDLDYVPNASRRADVTTALSNSFGFGGQNACLVVRRYSAD